MSSPSRRMLPSTRQFSITSFMRFRQRRKVDLPQPDGPISAVTSLRLMSRRSEEHTSELQSLMRISYAVFCLKKKKNTNNLKKTHNTTYPVSYSPLIITTNKTRCDHCNSHPTLLAPT